MTDFRCAEALEQVQSVLSLSVVLGLQSHRILVSQAFHRPSVCRRTAWQRATRWFYAATDLCTRLAPTTLTLMSRLLPSCHRNCAVNLTVRNIAAVQAGNWPGRRGMIVREALKNSQEYANSWEKWGNIWILHFRDCDCNIWWIALVFVYIFLTIQYFIFMITFSDMQYAHRSYSLMHYCVRNSWEFSLGPGSSYSVMQMYVFGAVLSTEIVVDRLRRFRQQRFSLLFCYIVVESSAF